MTTMLEPDDLCLFNEGTHRCAYRRALGAHPAGDGVWRFAVWALHEPSVAGDFNGWSETEHSLSPRRVGHLGRMRRRCAVWDRYKFFSIQEQKRRPASRADPFAFCSELRSRHGIGG